MRNAAKLMPAVLCLSLLPTLAHAQEAAATPGLSAQKIFTLLFLKLPPRPRTSTPNASTPRKPRAPRQPRPVPPPPAPAPPPRPLPYAVVSSTDGPYPNPNLSICGLKNWPP